MKRYNRKSIRLKDFDYSQEGRYFITICTNERKCLFGEIKDGEIILNEAGRMIDRWWQKLSDKYDVIEIDEYRIMPNHIHGIINIVGAHPCVRPNNDPCVRPNNTVDGINCNNGQTHGSAPTVGTIIQWFKTMSTNEYIRNVKNNDRRPFNKQFWQRNYYEHVIRNDEDLNRIREYIRANPSNWGQDHDNPKNFKNG